MAKRRSCTLWLLCLVLLLLAAGAMADSSYALKIANIHDVVIGNYCTVPITIESVGETGGDTIRLGGVDLLIGYGDRVTFITASPGVFMNDCEWEYFIYRFIGSGYPGCCVDCSPVSLIRMTAIADIINGAPQPSCFYPDQTPIELVRLTFQAGTQTTGSFFSPINFYWTDCGSNALSDSSGYDLLIADNVFDTILSLIIPGPPCGGPEDSCYDSGAIRKVDFYNGGVTRRCGDVQCLLGDINLDGVAYTIADAVLFVNYFIWGLPAFIINLEQQIEATDTNCDGIVLSVADLVYLIRVITGDAVPCSY